MRNTFFPAYGLWHCGEGFQTVLIMWYMAFHARLSPAEIGFYQSLQLVPFLLFTALGGSVTDRIGARASFAASTGLFALSLGLYGLADPAFGFNGPLFAGYCLLSGLLSAIANPAIDTFIPEATPAPATKNALLAATVHNVAKLSGNAVTLALPILSALGGFVANGLLMAASALLLLRHPRAPRPVPQPRGAAAPGRLAAHFRAHPQSFDILLSSAVLGLFMIPAFYVFQPLMLRTWYPQQEGLFGLVGVMGWIGAIAASATAARLSHHINRPGALALAVWAVLALLFASLPLMPGFAAYLLAIGVLGMNGLGKALVYGTYLRDAPARDRALLIGLDHTAFWGLATLGTLGLGLLAEAAGLVPALLANTAALLACLIVLALRGRLTAMDLS
jgi:MFS family permease